MFSKRLEIIYSKSALPFSLWNLDTLTCLRDLDGAVNNSFHPILREALMRFFTESRVYDQVFKQIMLSKACQNLICFLHN